MDISTQLAAVAKAMGCQYTIKGEPVTYEHVFSTMGLLPAILRRADQLCSFCLGYGLGLTFERSESATLSVTVLFDPVTPTTLRLLCATDVLHEFMQQAPSPTKIALDDLMTD
ncbi:MAG TPA: type IV secretion IcmS family protein [Gammaproteobacteria bacterium]|nr:type IV secretion IcmS family protein [Gammaproteobacteria bacterium]